MHTLLDHGSHLPLFIQLTDAKTHEIRVARALSLPVRSIVIVDKACIDFDWHFRINNRKRR